MDILVCGVLVRLAVIVKYFPPGDRISGLTSFIDLLLTKLAKKWEIHLICQSEEKQVNEWAKNTGIKSHALSHSFWLAAPWVVRKIQPDIVLVVSGVHKVGLVYPIFSYVKNIIGHRIFSVFLQGVNLDAPPGYFASRLLQRFDKIICTSPKLASDLSKLGSETVEYVPPGVDLEHISSVNAASKRKPIRIGFINHMSYVKGCDRALKAFSRLPSNEVEYFVAGQGELDKQMRQKYQHETSINFKGYLSNSLSEIKSCDIMVLPFRSSVTVLGLSQTVLECMAAGVPVIGTNHDTITAIVRDGREGMIVENDDELVQAIQRLSTDSAYRDELSSNARQRARDFDMIQIANTYNEILRGQHGKGH